MVMTDSQRCPEKLCLFKYEIEINVYNLQTDYFQLRFLYQSDLRLKNLKKLSESNTVEASKNDRYFKVTVVNRALPSLHLGYLEITLTSL